MAEAPVEAKPEGASTKPADAVTPAESERAARPMAEAARHDSSKPEPDSAAPWSAAATETETSTPAPMSRGLLLGLAAATLMGIGCLWLVLRPSVQPSQPVQATQLAAASEPEVANTREPVAPPPLSSVEAPSEAPSPLAAAPATASPDSSSAALAASAAVAASAAGAAPTASESPPSEGVIVVTVEARPRTAKFYYRGKEVSGVPMRVELAPGQKRSFEVGLPGYITRKVLVDGSKPEIFVGLNPTQPAPASSGPARIPRAAY